jgi:glucose/arabinose dehydrogenase
MEEVGFPGVLGRAIRLAIMIGVLVPAPASAGVRATVVGTFSAPTYIAAPPGDTHRLFVVEQAGQIELIKDGGTPTTFLDISNEVKFAAGGEQGLLSMAFSPDYATSGRFYVYYTSTSCPTLPGCDEHVSEFTADPSRDTASAGTERVLITIPHPSQNNHNGGQLQFGPDGDLYISVGDGGGGNDTEVNAQHKTTLLGKILRISPQPGGTYTIPAGNPFTGGPECSGGPSSGSANCPEIWAYGLRNPWRFSFDSATGDMVIADVGQSAEEEIDFAPRVQNVGANYGWPCYEGLELDSLAPASECAPLPSPVVFPVLSYPHPQNCGGAPFCGDGIIGGYVMHDPTLPSLDGCYVYGDLATPGLRIVHLAQPSASASVALGPDIGSLSTFGLDAGGHVYAADNANGDVYRIESDGNPATDPRCAPPSSLPAPPQQAPINTSIPTMSPRRPPPRLSALKIRPTVFRAIRGATVTFRLDEKATVTFTVQRARSGRAVNGHCRPGTRALRKARRCTIWIVVPGRFSIKGRRGTDRFRFTGRIGGHTLGPGDYRLVARARDAAGNTGKPKRAHFSIRT